MAGQTCAMVQCHAPVLLRLGGAKAIGGAFVSLCLVRPSSVHIQWAQKVLQCLAVLDYLQCGALQCENLT